MARSPYQRTVRPGMTTAEAERAVDATCVWHLRVLAGWLPPGGAETVRVFAAWFEIDDVADRLGEGGPSGRPAHDLGTLAVLGRRLSAAAHRRARDALRHSSWGDPGAVRWPDTVVALQARWIRWLDEAVPGADAWATGAAALLAARPRDGGGLPPSAVTDLTRVLGRGWERATSTSELVAVVPSAARWAIDGLEGPDDLVAAEGRWWQRLDRDAAATMRRSRPGPELVAAAAARLVADARWTRSALAAAGWGATGLEAFDAVA